VSKLNKRNQTNKIKNPNLDEIFSRAEKFFDNLNSNDKIALIHDSDPDGVCSATIMLLSLEKLGVKLDVVLASSPEDIKKTGLIVKNCSKVIALDLAPHLYSKDLEDVKSGKVKIDLLIFDHHMVYDIESENIFYVNPRLIENSLYMPTSYLVLKYYERCVDTKDMEWMSAIGTVADYGIKDETRDLLSKFLKEEDYKDVWKSEYGKAAITLNAATAIVGAEKCLKIMMKLKSFEEFKKVPEFRDASKKFDEELAKGEKETREKMEIYPDIGLMVSFVHVKYRHVASTISSILSREGKNKDMTLILFEEKNGEYKLHGRSQSGKVNIGLMFHNLGVGGGHVQAGGGSIKVKELPEFKERLMREIRKFDREKGQNKPPLG